MEKSPIQFPVTLTLLVSHIIKMPLDLPIEGNKSHSLNLDFQILPTNLRSTFSFFTSCKTTVWIFLTNDLLYASPHPIRSTASHISRHYLHLELKVSLLNSDSLKLTSNLKLRSSLFSPFSHCSTFFFLEFNFLRRHQAETHILYHLHYKFAGCRCKSFSVVNIIGLCRPLCN